MPAEQLERLVMDFIYGEFDVLVSTTIVENGIDIPNANTIIVDGAQNYGLSDLHQLRGRVGEVGSRGLLLPVVAARRTARQRCNAAASACHRGVLRTWGRGFNIAMQDLDIRGAGNLLGAEQSGFIADIGFGDLSEDHARSGGRTAGRGTRRGGVERPRAGGCRTVALCGGCGPSRSTSRPSCPTSYVSQTAEKLRLYRELDAMRSEEELQRFEQRLVDRFGALPQAARELLDVVRLRWEAVRLGMERVKVKNGLMIVHFVGDAASPFYKSEVFSELLRRVTRRPDKFVLKQHNNRLAMTVRGVTDIAGAWEILKSLYKEQDA